MAYIELEKIFKDEFSNADFTNYISKLKYSEGTIKSDLATFIAPNIFIENWIKTKFHKKIALILQTHLNITPEIKIISEINKKGVKSIKQIVHKAGSSLNPSFIFSSFVVGKSNEFAYKIAQAVASDQSIAYNPVLFYGKTGLGKTHLLNAIGNVAKNNDKNIIYITSEQFLNDFILHLQNNSTQKFREKYRSCDYLLIDDIQFFGGKQQVQEEFFHTFNELVSKNKQIILTSDKNVSQIAGLEMRLKSRFNGGLNVDIKPPELDTKIKIIKQKCVLNHIQIDAEIIEFIATNVGENIREIEGLIIKLNAQSSILGTPITKSMAENAIRDDKRAVTKNISVEKIIALVAHELNVKPSEIASKNKNKDLTKARYIAIYLCRILIPNSMSMIAAQFNMKNHSSISKAFKTINEKIIQDRSLKLIIDELKNKI
ncbi:MAG: chromosomal replication initiator protein DnaA [Helicobacter sp.]|nr:chromosomal replication initiator protein DnaA [Helicobacter sp.]